jgi:hypothetical protein
MNKVKAIIYHPAQREEVEPINTVSISDLKELARQNGYNEALLDIVKNINLTILQREAILALFRR